MGRRMGKLRRTDIRQLTIQMRDNSFDVIIKGDKAAIKTDSGWKSAAEILAVPPDGGGPPPPEWRAAMVARNLRTPAELAEENLDGLQNIQKTDDGYTADLTADAAKQQLSFGRDVGQRQHLPTQATHPPPPQFDITSPKGSVKLTVKDGNLTQVEFHISGSVSFNGGDPRDVDITRTTAIKDVGSTTLDVPDEAKAKLGS